MVHGQPVLVFVDRWSVSPYTIVLSFHERGLQDAVHCTLCQSMPIRVSGNLISPREPLAKGYYKWHPEIRPVYRGPEDECFVLCVQYEPREGVHCTVCVGTWGRVHCTVCVGTWGRVHCTVRVGTRGRGTLYCVCRNPGKGYIVLCA